MARRRRGARKAALIGAADGPWRAARSGARPVGVIDSQRDHRPGSPVGAASFCQEFTTSGDANPSDANRGGGPSTGHPNRGRVSTNSGKDRTPTERLARRRQPAWRRVRAHPPASPTPCRSPSPRSRPRKPKQQFSGFMTTPPFWSPVNRHPDQKLSHLEFTDAEGVVQLQFSPTTQRRGARQGRNVLNEERRCIAFISWMTVL